jgi:ubiquinone/menaquinone biosynthesis C-methylase UbiE
MSVPARFGRLARIYRWMEYLSFGPYLQQCRVLRLPEMTSYRRALVYGDGDGRFLAELVRRVPQIQVATIDASKEMLRRAAQRLPSGARVRLVQADALAYEAAALPEAPFDLIVIHFFLDCFDEEELATLLMRVNAASSEGAMWVVSDFAIPQRPVARQAGGLVVRGLYLAFGLLTGLRTRRLPDHGRVMREAGWSLEDRRTLLEGLLISERWRRVLFSNSDR